MATPFVESNVQAMKVKQMQDELKEMETKAVDLNTSKGSPVERGALHFMFFKFESSTVTYWISGLFHFKTHECVQVYSG